MFQVWSLDTSTRAAYDVVYFINPPIRHNSTSRPKNRNPSWAILFNQSGVDRCSSVKRASAGRPRVLATTRHWRIWARQRSSPSPGACGSLKTRTLRGYILSPSGSRLIPAKQLNYNRLWGQTVLFSRVFRANVARLLSLPPLHGRPGRCRGPRLAQEEGVGETERATIRGSPHVLSFETDSRRRRMSMPQTWRCTRCRRSFMD